MECKRGCSTEDILTAIGLTWDDVCTPRERSGRSQVTAEYPYPDEHGTVLYTVKRHEPGFDGERKTFRPYLPGARKAGLGNVRRILYRLPHLLAAIQDGQTVYVVEGEKDVDRLARNGIAATCNVGGASKPGDSKWRPEYVPAFTGANVVIIADRDAPGLVHARNVRDSIAHVAKSVTVVQAVPDHKGADLSDHLDAGYSLDDLVPLDLDQDDTTEDTATEDDETQDRFPSLDWHAVFAMDFSQVDWMLGKFMERGQQVALVGDGKSGKSLFALDWLWRATTGRPFLGDQHRDPIKALYFDRENSVRDIVTRLQTMGATPDELAGRFDYRLFPRFSGQLDTSSAAAAEFAAIVDEVRPDVVIIDTASRFIAGKENDSDPWLQLYARVHVELKRRGVACVRLDHFGKDKDRGARGNSAKTQDVDHVWELTSLDDTRGRRNGVETVVTRLKLKRTHTRTGLGDDEILFARRARKSTDSGQWLPGQTRHELLTTTGALGEDVPPAEGTPAWLVHKLDEAKAPDGPDGWGNPTVIKWCAENNIKIGKTKIAEAVKIRKARTSGDLPPHLPYSPVTEGSPESGEGDSVSPGQTFPGKVERTTGEPPNAPSFPHPPSREGEGGDGASRRDHRVGSCLGCHTPMDILEDGQLWHYRNKECEQKYRQSLPA